MSVRITSARRGRLIAAVLAVTLPVGCTGREEPVRPAGPPSLELAAEQSQLFFFGPLPAGSYVAYGLSTGVVREPLTVTDVQPLSLDGAIEYVGSRLAFFACDRCHRRPGEFGVRALLGSTCGPVEPANRALRPAVGQTLQPNDAPHLVMIGRITGTGRAAMSGAKVTYRVGGKEHVQTTPVHGVEVRPDTPPADPPCADTTTSLWFGGSAEVHETAPLG